MVLLLGIPLTGLEHQDTDEDKGEDGVAGREDLEAVLATENHLTSKTALASRLPLGAVPDTITDGAETLDGVGDVDSDGDEVQDDGGSVEEEVGLARAVHLDEETEEGDTNGDVQNAVDDGRRVEHELEMYLQLVKVLGCDVHLAPEEGEVIGKLREENTQEETGGYKRG